ncbi:VOC family protein [Actinomadura geliboluensis]|uniref:VOC family protein n=1 Tax=Actinomadura geliboluensis TaxID=882440 RepID=UPI003719030A
MPGNRISVAHVELYVSDHAAAVDYFTRGLLFEQVAVADGRLRRSTLLRSHSVHVVVTTPTAPDGPVADFLARHGDGVADVALHTDDLPALLHAADQADMRILQQIRNLSRRGVRVARIRGAGSVHHTLIAGIPAEAGAWPPGFSWKARPSLPPGLGAPPQARPRSIDHVAWCLPAEELGTAAARYRDVLGLRVISTEQMVAGSSVASSYALQAPAQVTGEPSGEASGQTPGLTVVLTAPDRARQPVPGGQIDAYLAAHGGGGVQHIAFGVADIVTAVREQSAGGVRFLDTPAAYYRQLPARITRHPAIADRLEELQDASVLVDLDLDDSGLLLQIFTAAPHVRKALFYELVQRVGSSGFGQRNIRALFEARERADAAVPGTQR